MRELCLLIAGYMINFIIAFYSVLSVLFFFKGISTYFYAGVKKWA